MLKRKYGNRSGWNRVVEREYTQTFIEMDEFKGYVTLLKINKVTESLYVQYGDRQLCIADDGYIWLQHFPDAEHYSVTTMFDSNGNVVQWYIDICSEIGIINSVPWMADLFLDLVVFPTKEMILLDSDELEEALDSGIINESLHRLALNEANRIRESIETDQFQLLKHTVKHKNFLLKQLNIEKSM